MGFIIDSSGKQYRQYPVIPDPKPKTVSHTVTHVVSDPTGSGLDHKVVIDASSPNIDEAHIYLEGPVAIDKFFIKCRNPNITDPAITDPTIYDPKSDVFLVNGEGSIKCNAIESPEITTLFETIGEHAAGFLDLHNQQVAIQAAAETLDGRVSQNETDIAGLITDVDIHGGNFDTIEHDINVHTNLINDNGEAIEGLDTRITQTEEDITGFSGQMNNASIISQSQENRIEALEQGQPLKADLTALDPLDVRITQNTTALDDKASVSFATQANIKMQENADAIGVLENAQAHSDHVQITAAVATLNETVSDIQDTMDDNLGPALGALDGRVGVLEDAQAHSDHVQITQDVADLQTALPLKADTSVLTEYVLKTENQTEISAIDTRIGVLEDYPAHANHDEITASVATLNETVSVIQNDHSELTEDVNGLIEDMLLKANSSDLDTTDDRVTNLESLNPGNHNINAIIDTVVATLNSSIDDNTEEISTTNENISTMNGGDEFQLKANDDALATTNQTVSVLTEIVDTKANHGWANEYLNQNEDAITALTTVVSNKASQASVNILTGNVGSLDATQQQILDDISVLPSQSSVTDLLQQMTSFTSAQSAAAGRETAHLADLDDHMESAQQDIDGVKEDIATNVVAISDIVQAQEEHVWSPWQDVLGYEFTVDGDSAYMPLISVIGYDAHAWKPHAWGWPLSASAPSAGEDYEIELYGYGQSFDNSISTILQITHKQFRQANYNIGLDEYEKPDGGNSIVDMVLSNKGYVDELVNQNILGTLSSASVENTPYTLVRRDGAGSFIAHIIHCFAVQSTSSQVINGDGHFLWVPHTASGTERMVPNWTSTGGGHVPAIYRFGRDHENLALTNDPDSGGITAFDSTKDGIHMLDDGQLFSAHASSIVPSLLLGGYKNTGNIPYIHVRLFGELDAENFQDVFTVSENETRIYGNFHVYAKNDNSEKFSVVGNVVTVNHTFKCHKLESTEQGGAFSMLDVRNLVTGNNSVWLGSKLHISESGTAKLQLRKDTIPKYLQELSNPVVLGDLSVDIEDVQLKEFIELSVAHGGSDDLSVIFPRENVGDDFFLQSKFNEVVIEPENANQENSGLTIRNELGGHPCIFLEGSDSEGRGLIQFSDVEQSGHLSLIYNSVDDDGLHIDTSQDLWFDATSVQLYQANCDIYRGGVGVYSKLAALETSISALGDFHTVEKTNEEAKFTILSRVDGAGDTGEISLEFKLDRNQLTADHSGQDMIFSFENYNSDLQLHAKQFGESAQEVDRVTYSVLANGDFLVAGGKTAAQTDAYSGYNGGKNFRVLGTSQFFDDITVTGADIEIDGTLVKAKLDSISTPLLVRNTVHLNPGSYTNWTELAGVSVFVHDVSGASNLSRYRLPETVVDGMVIDLFLATTNGSLILHTGAHQTVGLVRKMKYNSVGRYSDYEVALSGVNRYMACYISETNEWLIL